MKTVNTLTTVALVLAGGLAVVPSANAAEAGASKPIVKTTCEEFMAMDETIRPKFIYYALGHSSKGRPEAVLDIAGTATIQPELEQYCKVNLTKSAYEHMMQTSIASEKAARKEHGKAAAPAKK